MTLINLTPHPIRVYEPGTPSRIDDEDQGVKFVVPPEPQPARLAMISLGQARLVGMDDGRSTYVEWLQFGQCDGIPDAVPGVTYIVAMVVARDQTHRSDLVFPRGEIRNARGTVVGCLGFGQVC